MSDRVSVIIPTYNRDTFIKEAIESALYQTYPAFEIIVVDDGSTDNTKEVVQKFGMLVKYLYQTNRGPAAARNLGLKLAQGDFIAFLDSDDIWELNKNWAQVTFLRKYEDVEMVFGHLTNVREAGTHGKPEILNEIVYRYFKENYAGGDKSFEYLTVENIIPTPSVMFRTKCIEKIGYIDETLQCAEDYDYWLRFAYHCQIGFIDQVLVKRRMHKSNIINDYILMHSSKLNVLEKIKNGYQDLPDSSQRHLKNAINHECYRIGSYYFKLGDLNKSYKFLKRAFPDYLIDWKYDIKLFLSFLKSFGT